MEPVSDNEGVASSGTPVAVAHTRPTTTRPVIANSSRAEVSDILSVAAVHSSSHSFRLWEGVSHSVGAWMYSCFFVRIEDLSLIPPSAHIVCIGLECCLDFVNTS